MITYAREVSEKEWAFRKWARECPFSERVLFTLMDEDEDRLEYSVNFSLKIEKEEVT